ncbi:hypothetical protein EXIGLDRAFT_844708 [Exidia glandulosa HHB12029]|uniref:DUF6534 domain-containing protein n=1 Tax=Exidia glandulosa HHB12029 TaxID=1314781 RepID=A0A165BVM4_EXIGL|nr:hypothetical protein EXIGLDRAFT_844708 [Exidia glandulosa HHB12029]
MTTNATDLPPPIQFIVDHPAQTIGAWFCGGVGDFVLQGAIVALTVEYFARYPNDDRRHHALVIVMSVLNMLKTIQTIAILWHKLVLNFGDYYSAAGSTWFSISETLASEVICLIAQLYFISRRVASLLSCAPTNVFLRLYRMLGSSRILIILPLALTVTMGLAGNIALTVEVYHLPTVQALSNFNTTVIVALSGVLASDTIVTIATSLVLVQSKSGYKRTDSLISRLLRLTWLSAAFPAISALLNLVTYVVLAPSGNSYFIAFNFIMPKLYTISMLYTLNSRRQLAQGDQYIMSSQLVARSGGIVIETESIRFTDGRATEDTTADAKVAPHDEEHTYHEHPPQKYYRPHNVASTDSAPHAL